MDAVKDFFIRRCGKSENGRPGPWKSVFEQECSDDKNPGDRVSPGFVRTCVLSFLRRPA